MTNTVEEQAYDHLRRKLTLGTLLPGTRVSALAMAKEIGVSPTPVTQAIRRLQIEGLVELVPHVGTFVKKPDPREIEELFELRIALEGFAVAKAVVRLTPHEVDDLERTCRTLEEIRTSCQELGEGIIDADTVHRASLADLQFHRLIARASGNRRIVKLMDDSQILMRGMAVLPSSGNFWAQNLTTTIALHREVLDAIRRRDRKAARKAIIRHLRDSIKETRSYFRHFGGGGTPANSATSVYDVLTQAGAVDAPLSGSAPSAAKGRARSRKPHSATPKKEKR